MTDLPLSSTLGDLTPPPAQLGWTLITPYATSFARLAGAAVSGWLIGHGLTDASHATEVTSVVSGIVVGGAMQAWSWTQSGKLARYGAQINHLMELLFSPEQRQRDLDHATGVAAAAVTAAIPSLAPAIAQAAAVANTPAGELLVGDVEKAAAGEVDVLRGKLTAALDELEQKNKILGDLSGLVSRAVSGAGAGGAGSVSSSAPEAHSLANSPGLGLSAMSTLDQQVKDLMHD